ncbi:hypothetical protein KMW28_26330 [Flammeovirga yaeyamensis]|uniref:Uncharacterized protein n=2 Tax=Flammeovirga yaeyamensis TaxID=367791 RepID=A0AAX1NDM7_9BACT|nr:MULTISPECIES: hypothetical protein [Flammeovirga]ANQ52189.1 hypothetical protein MY04_4854 [Flammeovirga sp. MY04]MBB3699179.1 hypothetical protein [Flammeovirga yaeyamensis]NMF35557.1 hypothetical protein [Flammeovirga yaeyamensis]QWG04415.1 hypothetical protein KMW28_26330 [Flammeovirga yaeyamensis]
MKLIARLATLLLLSVCLFSCDDDDDSDPRDVNYVYFVTDEIPAPDEFGDPNVQLQFNTSSNNIEVVIRTSVEIGTAATTVVAEYTQDVTSYNRDGDNYSIQIDSGSTYNQELKADVGCVSIPDSGFSMGKTTTSVSLDDILVWDSSNSKYYIPGEKLGELLGVVVDPEFGQGGGGNVVYPKIWSSDGSIMKCGEFPTNLPN